MIIRRAKAEDFPGISKDNPSNAVALFYPQWQGAGHSPELFDGTVALWNLFSPQITSIRVPVSKQMGLTKQNEIIGLEQIKEQILTANTLLQDLHPTRIVTIGGGCDVEVAIVSYLRAIHDPFGIIWFDAHGDLNTPESSPSQLFHGMALRCLLEGTGRFGFHLPIPSISTKDIALLGVRDLDPPEKEYVRKNSIPVVPAGDVSESLPEKLVSQFKQYKKMYIHIDLDVLDPGEYRGVKCPTANGIQIKRLCSVLQDIMERWDVIGLSLVENIEIDEEKLSALEPIIQLARKF
ncbi:MAG: arginase family protein [Firmicutes bacterium]|nr:arginase family protein [Bacillota bacterium]